MIISEVTLQGFRCFGPTTTTVGLDSGLTVLIGDNGSGKTALMLALLRVLGPGRQSIVRQDFRVPPNEVDAPSKRALSIELKLVFPELAEEGTDVTAVPEFFNQMTVDEDGAPVCRPRLEATWVDDGTDEGVIDQQHYVVLPPDPGSGEAEKLLRLGAEDRAHLRMVYVPAVRDGTSHMTNFLRGRLWRAMRWSDNLRETLRVTGARLNDVFLAEPGVARVSARTAERWSGLYAGGTHSTPVLAPVDVRLGEFVRGVQMEFRPDESGGDRPLSELSDGQRSLFHISMTAAALDIESGITDLDETWDTDKLIRPALTVVAVEEPENNLSPFYLSRIIRQLQDISGRHGVQAIISSHSPSVLARIDPSQIRHFSVDDGRSAQVRNIALPADPDDAAKYVREAVRTYPELYFASFVILGEGSSEEVVIPRIAEAMGVEIDRSFVAVVPLGGRHVNHLWRLLTGLGIPHATLLDLDIGRDGGGWGRIRNACDQLLATGTTANDLFGDDALGHDAQGTSWQGWARTRSGPTVTCASGSTGSAGMGSTSANHSTSTWPCCAPCGSTTPTSHPGREARRTAETPLRRSSAAKAPPAHTPAPSGPLTSPGTGTCSSAGASRTPMSTRWPARPMTNSPRTLPRCCSLLSATSPSGYFHQHQDQRWPRPPSQRAQTRVPDAKNSRGRVAPVGSGRARAGGLGRRACQP
jgi:hypothetical protein